MEDSGVRKRSRSSAGKGQGEDRWPPARGTMTEGRVAESRDHHVPCGIGSLQLPLNESRSGSSSGAKGEAWFQENHRNTLGKSTHWSASQRCGTIARMLGIGGDGSIAVGLGLTIIFTICPSLILWLLSEEVERLHVTERIRTHRSRRTRLIMRLAAPLRSDDGMTGPTLALTSCGLILAGIIALVGGAETLAPEEVGLGLSIGASSLTICMSEYLMTSRVLRRLPAIQTQNRRFRRGSLPALEQRLRLVRNGINHRGTVCLCLGCYAAVALTFMASGT